MLTPHNLYIRSVLFADVDTYDQRRRTASPTELANLLKWEYTNIFINYRMEECSETFLFSTLK